MSRTKRFLFHVLLWLALWLFAWLLTSGNMIFLQTKSPAFLMQIVVIAVLIYYTAPTLLLKKNYTLFTITSLLLIVICCFLLSTHIIGAIDQLPPHLKGLPGANHDDFQFERPPLIIPLFFTHFLVLTIAYVLATFIETFLFAQKKEEEIIINKNEALKLDLRFLKSQINPHFLFNSLNNIYALSAIDSDKTQQSISYLSNMLRYVLYECEQELVPLEKEISYIENYIKLFLLKSSKTYSINTNYNLANKNVKIAPMLFIPFMENALKHSNIEKIADSFIRLNIDSLGYKIRFNIENSKSNTPKIKNEIGGIGIENVKKRLAIVYPKKHDLIINETANTYKVTLNIDSSDNH